MSFDSPLDQAVEVNLLGPVRIVQTLAELGVAPHLVAVSTCYVAGSRRGAPPEEAVDASPFFVDVDWRTEVDSARRIRNETETDSRTPEHLRDFRGRAPGDWGPPGLPAWPPRPSSCAPGGWRPDGRGRRGAGLLAGLS
ncbi:MAG: hypothetical protein Ct9H300mP31_17800 [Acidimicrobiaceae bacterium]|nr:MAG: hypothetical protein Ct9H300mP31_17800 [Acidimicrobiaceae bacterium]